MTKYNKAFVALATAIAQLGAALGDGHITGVEWTGIALAALSAVGVYAVGNSGS